MFTVVTITGTFERPDGEPSAGTITAQLSQPMTNGEEIVEATPILGEVTGGQLKAPSGEPFTLVANDDVGTEPVNVRYRFTLELDNAPVRSFFATVPHTVLTVDISELQPMEAGGPRELAGISIERGERIDADDVLREEISASATGGVLTTVGPPAPSFGAAGQINLETLEDGEALAIYGPKRTAVTPNAVPAVALGEVPAGYKESIALLAGTFANCEARGTVGVVPGGEANDALFLFLRAQATGSTLTAGYEIKFGADFFLEVKKVGEKIGEITGVLLTPGEEVAARMIGHEITIWHLVGSTWTQYLGPHGEPFAVSDSTYATGHVGVGTQGVGGTETWTAFGGGEVPTAVNPTWGGALYLGGTPIYLPKPTGSSDPAEDTGNLKEAARRGHEGERAKIVACPGEYVVDEPIPLYSFQHWQGAGFQSTIFKLANGSNCDLMQGNEFATLTGTKGAGKGITGWKVSDLCLHGNGKEQSKTVASWPLRVFGYYWQLENTVLYEGRSGGFWTEDSGLTPSLSEGGTTVSWMRGCHVSNYIGPGETAGTLTGCKTTLGSPIVTVPTVDGLTAGLAVTAAGVFASGARIKELTGPKTIVLTTNAEATESNATLTIPMPGYGVYLNGPIDSVISDTFISSFNALGGNANTGNAATMFGLLAASSALSFKGSQIHVYGRHSFSMYLQSNTCFMTNMYMETGWVASLAMASSGNTLVGGTIFGFKGNSGKSPKEVGLKLGAVAEDPFGANAATGNQVTGIRWNNYTGEGRAISFANDGGDNVIEGVGQVASKEILSTGTPAATDSLKVPLAANPPEGLFQSQAPSAAKEKTSTVGAGVTKISLGNTNERFFRIILGGNAVIEFINAVTTVPMEVQVTVEQKTPGSHTVEFNLAGTAVKWSKGEEPTVAPSTGAVTAYAFTIQNAGTEIVGAAA